MYKDILVPILGRRGDMDALNAASYLAESESARLTALQMVYLPSAFSANWGLPRDMADGDVAKALRAEGESEAVRLRQRLAKESFQSEVRLVETSYAGASRTVAQHAFRTDLTVIAGALGDRPEAGTKHVFLASLFLACGGPVLVVPPRSKVAVPPRRIVVAWRATREATRAMHDAMPLLARAESVDLVSVDSTRSARNVRAHEAAEVLAHLAQHGVDAHLVVCNAGRRPVSAVLLDHARETRAEMLVCGGYGHSRLRESVLGGVTRELLISSHVPVLYSH